MLINSILSSTEGRENKFGTMEASKRISVKNLVSYEKAQNVLKDTRISEHAMTFDHGKAMIEEQNGGLSLEKPVELSLRSYQKIGGMKIKMKWAKIRYIRYDTQERWEGR